MVGTGRRYTAVASRQKLRKGAGTKEQESSFISSTPAFDGALSKFQ